MSDLMQAVDELDAAQKPYHKAKTYFEGTQEEVFASVKLRRALRKTGVAWRINLTRTVVTSVLNRLEINSVSCEDEQVQTYLDELTETNDFAAESDDVHQWGLVYGDAYVIVWPDDEGNVEIAYNSPRTTRVFYDPENPKRKKFASKVWETNDEKVRVNLYFPDRIEKYISRGKKPKSANEFERYNDLFDADESGDEVAVWPVPNPWGEIPVFHFRTERPYGRPEHFDAYGPQDIINKLVITQMATNDFHGFPQRYAIAGLADGDDDSFEEDLELDADFDPDAEGEAETSAQSEAKLKGEPGGLWWLENVKSVGQFDVANVDVFLEPFREYVKAMATMTSTPLHFFQGVAGQEPSGESRRRAESPLVKKCLDRIQNFEASWKRVFAFAVKIGLDMEDVPPIDIGWASVESHDDTDAWDVVQAKQESGVPMQQTLIEMGYEKSMVDSWFPDEIDPAEAMRRAEFATNFAAAAQRLAVAVESGILSGEDASSVLSAMVPREREGAAA